MREKEKTTVPIPSVGADGEQPTSVDNNEIISGDLEEINLEAKLSDEEFDEIQRRLNAMNLPGYLPTITMEELYEKVYQSKPPLIDGLLYPGVYLLAGAPKYGKSFLVAQMAYHISTGQQFWDEQFRKDQSFILHWKIQKNASNGGCSGCLVLRVPVTSTSQFALRSSAKVWKNR